MPLSYFTHVATKFILLRSLPMRFLIFSLVYLMLRIVFNVVSMMFAKTSLFFCIRLFVSNYVCAVPNGVMIRDNLVLSTELIM